MIPAGLTDMNIEIFFQEEVFVIQGGQVNNLVKIPNKIREFLTNFIDDQAKQGLQKMLIPEKRWLEVFLKCRYGHFDYIPDFTSSGETNPEFCSCGQRGSCPGTGLVCRKKDELTTREMEVAKLTAMDLPDKQIGDQLHIAYTTVRRHQKNIQNKTHSFSKIGTAVFAIKHNL